MGKNTPTPAEPGANRKALLNALEGYKQPRVDTRDVQAIQARIDEYLTFCAEKDIAPSIAGLANWLGVATSTPQGWLTGYYGSPEHQRLMSNFYGICQDIWAQKMDAGSINPVSGIFMGKAFYGYKDTQEIVIQHNVKNDQLSVSDLIAQAKSLPGGDALALPEGTQTIDADFRVIEAEKPIENDPRYEKAMARKKKADERKAESEALRPMRIAKDKARRKAYLKKYFQENKEAYNERHRTYRKRDKEEREKNKQAD